MAPTSAARRRLLFAGAALAATPVVARVALAAPAANTDLAGTTLRIATY
jgi:sulfonate transport system substrate-binding protein